MTYITQQQALERWEDLPEKLKEAVFSEYYADILWKVCEDQHLSEDKTQTIANLVGAVMMGFVLPDDLAKEIKDHLNINQEIANTVARDVDRKIFEPVRDEIREVYSPVAEVAPPLKPKGAISLETLGREPAPVPSIRIRPERQEMPAEGAPLIILQEENAPTPVQEEKKSFKGFEFPFGFFGKEGKPPAEAPVKVKIEGLGEKPSRPIIKKEERRVVHYSELRTPLTPFEKPEEEIINLETFGRNTLPALPGRQAGGRQAPGVKAPIPDEPPKKEIPIKPVAETVRLPIEPQPEPPKPEIKTEPPLQPKVEGNVVDLKN